MGYTVSECNPDIDTLKRLFIAWYNAEIADFDCPKMQPDEVYVVWFCYIVGNAKVLISTTRPDHMYYEITYHDEKKCIHVDAYKKFKHDDVQIKSDDTEKSGFDIFSFVSMA